MNSSWSSVPKINPGTCSRLVLRIGQAEFAKRGSPDTVLKPGEQLPAQDLGQVLRRTRAAATAVPRLPGKTRQRKLKDNKYSPRHL
jgi:hypothetical protein